MTHKYLLPIFTLTFSTAIGVIVFGQDQQLAETTSHHNRIGPFRPEQLSWDWTTEQWTGDDAPFFKIRQEVKEIKDKGNLT